MLERLMMKFGITADVAAAQLDNTHYEPRAKLVKLDGQPVLELKDDFQRGWRRVGISLDRLGFSVQDQNRSEGIYFVRYLNPTEGQEKGFLDKLLFWQSDDQGGKALDYRIALAEVNKETQVRVLNSEGKPEKSEAATRILTVLQEDLK